MVPKSLVSAVFAAALLASGSALAADYHPGDFLNLDLSKAVLSKTPLGPPTEFAPVAVEAKGDRAGEPAWARNELKVEPKQVPTRMVKAAPPHRASHVATATRRGTARVRLAHRSHGDPMNAQAMDTRIQTSRIQTWPCRSGGGICNWKR
jgi:hypothetical protein